MPDAQPVRAPTEAAARSAAESSVLAAIGQAGLRNHADESPVGIVVVACEDLLVGYVNAAFRRLAHAEDRVLVGSPFFEAFPLLATDVVRTALSEVGESHGSSVADLAVTVGESTEGDNARDLFVSVSRVRGTGARGSSGTAGGLVVQAVDAASRHAATSGSGVGAARETEPSPDLVEVNQRLVLAALREQDLKERAEAANSAKSMFLATMSHELRTPLNAIIGYASLLDEGMWGPIQEEQHRHLTRLKTSARHLLVLITDLLTLARVDADKETAYLERVASDAVLDEAISLTMPMALSKRLDFAVHCCEPFVLRTDRGKLLQILVNLIGNAIKFTDTGGLTLDVAVTATHAEFSVSDSGIGISELNLEHVFDMFWQAEQNLTRRAGGTGLGLNVSHRLAHLLGGDLRAESREGRGSTFTLTLPLGGP